MNPPRPEASGVWGSKTLHSQRTGAQAVSTFNLLLCAEVWWNWAASMGVGPQVRGNQVTPRGSSLVSGGFSHHLLLLVSMVRLIQPTVQLEDP